MIQKRSFSKFTNNISKLITFMLVLTLFFSTVFSVIVVSEKNIAKTNNYESNVDGAKLEYTPKSNDFGDICVDESASTIFDICNGASPPYDNLTYSISWDCDWVSVSPIEGRLAVFENDKIDVTIDTTGLDYGEATCEINIDSNAGDGVFDIRVNVISHPPDKPFNPNPEDDSTEINVESTELRVDVIDVDDDPLSVTFYDASDNSKIGIVENVQSGDTASITWDNLDYKTKYSWYAVSDDTFFETSSDVFSFTTTPPLIFSNVYPVNDSIGLSWDLDKLSLVIEDPIGDSSETFDWSIKTIPDIGSDNGEGSSGDTITCDINNLKSDKTYSWTVTATDSKGKKAESVFCFKTIKNTAPRMPIVNSPKIDTLNVSIICTLNWSCSDPDGDTNLIYDVYFGTNQNPTLLEKDITNTSYNISYDLELNTKYYWKIKVTDSFGTSIESSIFSFKTSTMPPPPSVGSINISFSRKLCRSGLKADIINNGIRDASNVNWEVFITGGLFNRVNVSNSGCIDRLNLNETQAITTYEFLNFKKIPFGLGNAKITLVATNDNGEIVGTKSTDVFLFFRWIILLT